MGYYSKKNIDITKINQMTLKEFKYEIGNKKEWYVAIHKTLKFYMVTRYPESPWITDVIKKEPMTLSEARRFRTILNKLTGK